MAYPTNPIYKFTTKPVWNNTDKKFDFVVGGVKRTYNGIEVQSIRQGQFTKFKCKNGAMVMINDSNVLMVETFEEE